jgi:flagellar motility protein MotE (MotC chaperone)
MASTEQIASRLEDAHPADAAPVLSRLSREQAAQVAEYLDPRTGGIALPRNAPCLGCIGRR